MALGRSGEDRAAEHYRAAGYAVLHRNWRPSGASVRGELDLVVARGRTLVVCEVKARRAETLGHPLEAVTPSKQQRIRRLAALYLRGGRDDQWGHGRWEEVRFDVVAILGDTLEVVEGAF